MEKMKKAASVIRGITLSIFMVLSLIACVTKADSTSDFGAMLYQGMLISMGIYLLFSIISIVVRLIQRKRMNEDDATKSAYTDVLIFIRNNDLIRYFRRIGLWGTLMLLVNIVVLHIPRSMIVGGPDSADVYLKGYHGFLLWSLISLCFTFVATLVFYAVYLPHYGTGAYNVFQYTGKVIIGDITAPVRVIQSFFAKNEKKSFSKIVNFITMVVFIVVNSIAIIRTI